MKIQNIHWSINDTSETIIIFLCALLSRHIQDYLYFFTQFKKPYATVKCVCVCIKYTCSKVSALLVLINTESVQAEDKPMDEEKTLAFQAEIVAHQHFLFQQENLSEEASLQLIGCK